MNIQKNIFFIRLPNSLDIEDRNLMEAHLASRGWLYIEACGLKVAFERTDEFKQFYSDCEDWIEEQGHQKYDFIIEECEDIGLGLPHRSDPKLGDLLMSIQQLRTALSR